MRSMQILEKKVHKRMCVSPYFCYDQAAAHLAAAHKVFVASNVSKLLVHLPLHKRGVYGVSQGAQTFAQITYNINESQLWAWVSYCD